MIVIPHGIHDVRHQFALRFGSIAQHQGVAVNGLLHLDDHPLQHVKQYSSDEQLSENPSSREDISRSLPSNQSQQAPSLIVPGLLGDSVRNLVAPLMCARKQLNCLGYNIQVAWVNGRTGSKSNAAVLREQIFREADLHGSAVDIIAYSKGCADSLHMLGEYNDTHDAVRSLVSLAGVVHGTPLAQDPPWLLRKLLQYAPVPGVPIGDGRAILDVSYTVRKQWLADHALPPTIYLANVVAAPCPSRVSRALRGSYNKLASLSSANDGQVIGIDTMLPGSELLAIVNADHWAIALPIEKRLPIISKFLVNQNTFPRNVLLRALIDHLGEVNYERSMVKNLEQVKPSRQ